MLKAGRLTERLTFLRREETSDGAGNVRGEWVPEFTVWAEMQMRPGSESFTQARMEGRIPASVRVRRSPQTMRIRGDWKAKDARGETYNVIAPTPDPMDRGVVMMTLMGGEGAAG